MATDKIQLMESGHTECGISVDTSKLSPEKLNQVHGIVDRLHDAEAYSRHYYNKAWVWKVVYWVVGILAPFAAQAAGIINIVLDQCNDGTKKWNAVMSFLLGSILMIFTFMRPDGRRQKFENAGDEYKSLVRMRIRSIFRSEESVDKIDYDDELSTLETEMLYLSKLYPEPGPKTLRNLKKNIDLGIVLENKGGGVL